MQVVCDYKCAIKLAESTREKREDKAFKADTRVMKKAIKDTDRAHWIKKAQTAFNAYIRARDAGLPCVSCGVVNPPITTGGQWDAGHFKTRGAYPELRFNEDNCHKQCKKCNGGSGNFSKKEKTVMQGYRERLINKIGIDKVEWLEGPHETPKLSIEEIAELKIKYKLKIKELRKLPE